jgi:hypothetical protein
MQEHQDLPTVVGNLSNPYFPVGGGHFQDGSGGNPCYLRLVVVHPDNALDELILHFHGVLHSSVHFQNMDGVPRTALVRGIRRRIVATH